MTTTQPDNTQTTERIVTANTFFKVSLEEPLRDLKESFMQMYKDQPELLISSGLMEV